MPEPFRLYEPYELGRDGYPPAWHAVPLDVAPWGPGAFWTPGDGLKHVVRALAEHRCVRCQHPYRAGEAGPRGEWSQCDTGCRHGGPVRYSLGGQTDWTLYTGPDETVVGPADLLEAQWRILTVHHLDMNKANCRWWNLPALCQRCHLEIQGRVQMARIWPWEHSEWFRPYVAGYYADVYLGEELTRGEVDDRLEELLALERMA